MSPRTESTTQYGSGYEIAPAVATILSGHVDPQCNSCNSTDSIGMTMFTHDDSKPRCNPWTFVGLASNCGFDTNPSGRWCVHAATVKETSTFDLTSKYIDICEHVFMFVLLYILFVISFCFIFVVFMYDDSFINQPYETV